MRFVLGGRARWVALGAVVAALAIGGFAYAAIPDSGGVFNACYKTNSGALRLVNSASDCTPSETATQWNQTGPSGSSGPSGASGPSGPSGPAGPTNAYASIYNGADFPVPSTGATDWITLRELTVPTGSYVVVAKTFVANIGSSATFVGCRLEGPTTELDDMGFTLAPYLTAGFSIGIPFEATFTGAGTLQLQCELPSGGTIKAGIPRIIATKVNTITSS